MIDLSTIVEATGVTAKFADNGKLCNFYYNNQKLPITYYKDIELKINQAHDSNLTGKFVYDLIQQINEWKLLMLNTEKIPFERESSRFDNEIEAEIPPNGNYQLSEMEISYMQSKIEEKYREILEIMHFDMENHNIQDTPKRVAKMYVRELFKGCYTAEPEITTFPNVNNVNQMVVVGPLDVKSTCSHHIVPFIGHAYIGYIPAGSLVGLSKFARILNWYMRRPQIQEELTEQIADYIENKLQPKGLGVYITAQHLCMSVRGVEQTETYADTCALRGIFKDISVKTEFINWISLKK